MNRCSFRPLLVLVAVMILGQAVMLPKVVDAVDDLLPSVANPVDPTSATAFAFHRRMARLSDDADVTSKLLNSPKVEQSIERGLAYLVSRQNSQGSWSFQGHGNDVILQSDTAATGLCLLALQGAGYTHIQHQHSEDVAKGLKFLIDHQAADGDLYRRENEISDNAVAFYSHAIAAMALIEAYGMTRDAALREASQRAIDFIAQTQHKKRGGWRYTPQVSADTSVTGWMMLALKSGEASGLVVPSETYDGIKTWLELARQSDQREDRYRYNPYAPSTEATVHGRMVTPTMTASGVLMRMHFGWDREHPAVISAADYLLEHRPRLGTPANPHRDVYYWFFASQVVYYASTDRWAQWNLDLQNVILTYQISAGPHAGSWSPDFPIDDRWGDTSGRIFETSMSLLCLEIYYRHLPLPKASLPDHR